MNPRKKSNKLLWLLGDSNTNGYHNLGGFVAKLNPSWTVVNHAQNNADVATVTTLMNAALANTPSPPDVAVISVGARDILDAYPAGDLDDVATAIQVGYDSIVATLSATGCTPIVAEGIGALTTIHPDDEPSPPGFDPDEVQLAYLDDGYQRVGVLLEASGEEFVDTRLAKTFSLWGSGPLGYVHAVAAGYEISAQATADAVLALKKV